MDIALVNVPPREHKKPHDGRFSFSRTMNFGLLSIATHLDDCGYDVQIYDLQLAQPDGNCDWPISSIAAERPQVVGLSCISGFSLPECCRIASLIRAALPTALIVIGGKDHVGHIAAELVATVPAIDVVVRGEGERVTTALLEVTRGTRTLRSVPNIVYRDASGTIIETDFDAAAFSATPGALSYRLYPDFASFPPSLEVSRGCTFGCSFCVSARTGVKKKSVERICSEAAALIDAYGIDDPRFYFETPMFLMSDRELDELIARRSAMGLTFTWRTETRVDYLTPERLERLYEAGLRVVDVGFESASRDILARMGKTRDPDAYVATAAASLQTASRLGLIAKFNVLFYVGETTSTAKETFSFFAENVESVRGISAYPLLLYPGSRLDDSIHRELALHGGSLVASPEWRARHLTPVNPSREFDYVDLQKLGLEFGKSFQSMDDYFAQRQYGYFAVGTTYTEFASETAAIGPEHFPFSSSAVAMDAAKANLYDALSAATSQREEAVV